jgi:hypothetical protein
MCTRCDRRLCRNFAPVETQATQRLFRRFFVFTFFSLLPPFVPGASSHPDHLTNVPGHFRRYTLHRLILFLISFFADLSKPFTGDFLDFGFINTPAPQSFFYPLSPPLHCCEGRSKWAILFPKHGAALQPRAKMILAGVSRPISPVRSKARHLLNKPSR